MPRYIEENDVYKLVEGTGVARIHCIQIDELPRADVQEVRHGKWKNDGGYDRCSICEHLELGRTNYCPNCGAKMDKEG